MIDHYDWEGGREAMLRFGPDTGPVVVMLPALFEDHNRTRALAVAMCRTMADQGIASLLPDLPGQGESIMRTADATLDHWQKAALALSEAQRAVRPVIQASMRGGAIMDSAPGVCGHWRLSPLTGESVIKALTRGTQPPKGTSGWQDDQPIEARGNLISPAMFDALQADTVLPEVMAPLRTVRLESDPLAADIKLPGPPLWHAAEPRNDPSLAKALAADLAAWSLQCAG